MVNTAAARSTDMCEPSKDADADLRPTDDVEALGLCALVWAAPEIARGIVEILVPNDFERSWYGSLFGIIAGLVRAERPHGARMVSSALARAGDAVVDGHRVEMLTRSLTDITTAGSLGYEANYYALEILAQSYRRGYVASAQALTQIAEEVPTDELFERMCVLGRERRAARERFEGAKTALSKMKEPEKAP